MGSSTYNDKAGKLDDAYVDDLLTRLNTALTEHPVEMTTERLNVVVRNYFGTVG